MKPNQLNRGSQQRLMYIENKEGLIDGVGARIGWVKFSKTGRTIYYRERTLASSNGRGIRGNYFDLQTREEYWISGVKKEGSNMHPCESTRSFSIDEDALEAYQQHRN